MNRLANYSVLTLDGQSFYWKTEDVKDRTQNAENLIEEVVEEGEEIGGGSIEKFILLEIDTCPRIMKAFDILSKWINTQHMFMAPCESHGL